MIKISATISKKVPIPGTEFSSQQYGASLEVEVSDADRPDVLRERIKELYSLLARTVDEQIAVGQPTQPAAATPPVNRTAAAAKPNGNGNGTPATQAQKRAVFAICKSQNIDPAQYSVDGLSVKQASALIDQLKRGQATAR